MSDPSGNDRLLAMLGGENIPSPDEFKQLILRVDTHRILAKVFLLEGTPHVFAKSPMKYVVFREQVADRFGVGSQDVCIVGSAKLGYSPSTMKYGTPFSQTSDVDVVVISEELFYQGSKELFACLNVLGPTNYDIRTYLVKAKAPSSPAPVVDLNDWRSVKESIRNFVYENFNPGLLPDNHPLRKDIFEKISSTSALFLALEPKVFVSKIRARVFRTWKAAEDYYANSLREAKSAFTHAGISVEEDDLEDTQEVDVEKDTSSM